MKDNTTSAQKQEGISPSPNTYAGNVSNFVKRYQHNRMYLYNHDTGELSDDINRPNQVAGKWSLLVMDTKTNKPLYRHSL